MRGRQWWLVVGIVVGLGLLVALSGAVAQQKAVSLTWTAGPGNTESPAH
jgi:hypothetical protein